MTQKRYAYDTFGHEDAQEINGKVVDIDWYYDPYTWSPPGRLTNVRIMYPHRFPYLLALADGEPGPPTDISLHTIRTVRVYKS